MPFPQIIQISLNVLVDLFFSSVLYHGTKFTFAESGVLKKRKKTIKNKILYPENLNDLNRENNRKKHDA